MKWAWSTDFIRGSDLSEKSSLVLSTKKNDDGGLLCSTMHLSTVTLINLVHRKVSISSILINRLSQSYNHGIVKSFHFSFQLRQYSDVVSNLYLNDTYSAANDLDKKRGQLCVSISFRILKGTMQCCRKSVSTIVFVTFVHSIAPVSLLQWFII